jgi:hypothetical protein
VGNCRQKVPEVAPKSIVDIRRIARRVIHATYPDLVEKPGPFPVDHFLEFKMRSLIGFNYHIQELPPEVEAATDPLSKLVTLNTDTYDDLCVDVPRARFTGCHEIGHALMHGASLRQVLINDRRAFRLYRRGDIVTYCDPEWQADTFSAELLMPAWHVQRLITKGADERDVMRIFKVSRQAAEIRLNRLSSK